MKDLVIIGTGGFGREVANMVEDINQVSPTWNLIGLVGENVQPNETEEGFPIIGDLNSLRVLNPRPYVVIAFADSQNRKRLAEQLEKEGFQFSTLIHPTVAMGRNVTIGEGSIICRGNFFTTHVNVGKHCILNQFCSFGHDTVLGDYISMMSRTAIAGDVHIAEGCYFGLHCTVINLVDIRVTCVFGAGAVVVKDINEPGTYVGVPAKQVK